MAPTRQEVALFWATAVAIFVGAGAIAILFKPYSHWPNSRGCDWHATSSIDRCVQRNKSGAVWNGSSVPLLEFPAGSWVPGSWMHR